MYGVMTNLVCPINASPPGGDPHVYELTIGWALQSRPPSVRLGLRLWQLSPLVRTNTAFSVYKQRIPNPSGV